MKTKTEAVIVTTYKFDRALCEGSLIVTLADGVIIDVEDKYNSGN
ncbi:hypothetical protein ACQKMI_14145 [Lysinibacillus sp. NPDC097214]